MRIWKWTLDVTDHQVVMLPAGAKLLSVQMQGELPQLWALCDEDAPPHPRGIAIYGTGHPLPEKPGEFLGTLQMLDGALVWHAFEVAP